MLLSERQDRELGWLQPLKHDLSAAIDEDRLAHGLLIYGSHGTGRRELARYLAERLLGKVLDENDQHPDYREIVPEADLPEEVVKGGKKSISVEQTRDLIQFMQLKSHQQGYKVAAIYPADKMTNAAANSFLKTLEEPPVDTALILVCERLNSLPATVISRCQHLRVSAPPIEAGLEWLDAIEPNPDWRPLLEFCGGAPIFARELAEQGFIDVARGYTRDLAAIQQRRADPVAIARKWVKTDLNLCFRWLYSQTAKIMRQQASAGNANQSTEACYVYLRELNELKRLQNGGISMETNLARMLFAWYGGFTGID